MHARKRAKKREVTLRTLRKSRGKTLKDVADALGTKVPTVSDWERGRRSPSPRYIPRYAEVLGIDALELAQMTT